MIGFGLFLGLRRARRVHRRERCTSQYPQEEGATLGTVPHQTEAVSRGSLQWKKNLELLREHIYTVDGRLDSHMCSTEQHFRDAETERFNGDRQLEVMIKAASTDGLNVAAVGAVWLACGVVLSSIPSELLKLVEWLADIRLACLAMIGTAMWPG